MPTLEQIYTYRELSGRVAYFRFKLAYYQKYWARSVDHNNESMIAFCLKNIDLYTEAIGKALKLMSKLEG